MHHVDTRVGQRERLGVAGEHGCRARPRVRRPGISRSGLLAGPASRPAVRVPARPAAGAARRRRRVRHARPTGGGGSLCRNRCRRGRLRRAGAGRRWCVDEPGPVGREVLQFVDVRRVPDVRAADHDERRGFDALAGPLAGFAGAFAGLAGALVALVCVAGLAGVLDVAVGVAFAVPGLPWSAAPGGPARWRRARAPWCACGAPGCAGHRRCRPRPSPGARAAGSAGGPAGRPGPLDGVEVGLAAQHKPA